MTLGEIIRKRRIEAGLTLDTVKGKIGCSKPYLSTIETGKVKNPPSEELLDKLEKLLGFEKGELIHIARLERMPSDLRHDIEISQTENQRLRKLVKDLLNKQQFAVDSSEILKENDISLEYDSKRTPNSVGLIPIINKVSAGYPVEFNDLDYPAGVADDYVRCPDIRDPNAFAVRVVGDSMQPNYNEGDVVVFSPRLEVRSGDDCFVRFEGSNESTFKRVFFEEDKRLRLQPRNEKYSPIFVEPTEVNGIYRAAIKYQVL